MSDTRAAGAVHGAGACRRHGGRAAFALLCAAGVVLSGVSARPALARPRIVCEEPIRDFGTVRNRDDLVHTFELRNRGPSTLEIQSVRTGCGCATAKLSRRRIPAGESFSIETALSLRGRRGIFHTAVFVHANDPETPRLCLRLLCTIERDVEAVPAHVVFSRAEEIEAGSKDVRVFSTQGHRLRVASPELAGDNGLFAVSLEELPGGTGAVCRVSLTEAGREPGAGGRATLILKTDHKVYPRLDIPLAVYVPRELMAVPRVLRLRKVRDRRSNYARSLVVLSLRAGTPEIESIVLPLDDMSAIVEPVDERRVRIDLEGLAPTARLHGREITIRVRRGEHRAETLTVPIQVR